MTITIVSSGYRAVSLYKSLRKGSCLTDSDIFSPNIFFISYTIHVINKSAVCTMVNNNRGLLKYINIAEIILEKQDKVLASSGNGAQDAMKAIIVLIMGKQKSSCMRGITAHGWLISDVYPRFTIPIKTHMGYS